MSGDTLQYQLSAEPAGTGGSVRFVLKATNIAGRTLTLYLRGRLPTVDITVREESGPVVWRRLEEGALPSILQVLTLRPGDSLVATALWEGRPIPGSRIPAGDYIAEAFLLTDGEPLRPPPLRFRLGRPSVLQE